jgi:hypothetical protein
MYLSTIQCCLKKNKLLTWLAAFLKEAIVFSCTLANLKRNIVVTNYRKETNVLNKSTIFSTMEIVFILYLEANFAIP